MTEYVERIPDAEKAEEMAYRDDMKRAHRKNELISMCSYSCNMKRLSTWRSDVWIRYPTDRDHEEYSHGACPEHIKELQRELDEFMARKHDS